MIDGFPEAECEFIGLILQDPVSFHGYRSRVPLDAFTNVVTRAVWDGMMKLGRAGTEVSIPALREMIQLDVDAARIPNVPSFLMACMAQASGELGLDDLAGLLCERALKAQISAFAGDLLKKVNDGRHGAEEIALEASAFLADVAAASRPTVGKSIHDAGKAYMDQLQQAQASGEARGHDWGIRTLDDLMGRIVVGDFGLIIGPSGHGKSSLARILANHIARREPVLTISAEETPEDIAAKDLIARTGIDSERLEQNTINASEMEVLALANQRQYGLPSFFEYTDDMRISTIEARTRAFKHTHGGCGALIIDTVDDVDPEVKGSQSIPETITLSCRKLDKLATKLEVPIIALGQVKTSYNERSDISLRLSDSYGGQQVRNKASWVLLVHRPQKKISDVLFKAASSQSERDRLNGQYDEWKDRAEFICAKRRRGRDGRSAKTGWSGPTTSFFDLDDDPQGDFDGGF